MCCDMKKQLMIEEGVEEIGKAFKLVAGTVINVTVPTLFKGMRSDVTPQPADRDCVTYGM